MNNRSDGTILSLSPLCAKCRCRWINIFVFTKNRNRSIKCYHHSTQKIHDATHNEHAKRHTGDEKIFPSVIIPLTLFFFFFILIAATVPNIKWHIKCELCALAFIQHISSCRHYSRFLKVNSKEQESKNESQSIFYTWQRRYTLSICRVSVFGLQCRIEILHIF